MKGCQRFGDTFLKEDYIEQNTHIKFHCLNTWQKLLFSIYIYFVLYILNLSETCQLNKFLTEETLLLAAINKCI